MKMEFCTLFDSNYLDKGIVCYESLIENCEDFTLYILPMDLKCSQVLREKKYDKVEVIDYLDFEDDELKALKEQRSRAEFCWTCTPKLILYVIKKYSVELCTYIDADMYFYKDPSILVKEMIENNSSVQVIRHNFPRFKYKKNVRNYGEYCVEFNTFLNNQFALDVLREWEEDCVRECSYSGNKTVFGDQKYLNKWPQKYNCVNVSQNQGAGVAPWNINKFIFVDDKNNKLKDKETSNIYEMVFFHFQNIRFLNENSIYCCPSLSRNYENVYKIYKDYICKLMIVKRQLKLDYEIDTLIKCHPAELENNKKGTKKNVIVLLYLFKEKIIRKLKIVKDVIICLN